MCIQTVIKLLASCTTVDMMIHAYCYCLVSRYTVVQLQQLAGVLVAKSIFKE